MSMLATCADRWGALKVQTLHVQVPSECPQEVADIISACMQRDAKARPSAREICRCVTQSYAYSPRSR